jgi:hypothetical protein
VEASRPIQLPAAEAAARERDAIEITAAIELVARGAARRVIVSGLQDAASLAPDAVASAQAEGVDFALARDPETGAISVVVGPLTE